MHKIESPKPYLFFTATLMTSLLSHSFNSNINSNMASYSNSNSNKSPLFDWGISRSYDDCVNLHVPSGEHNDLVASIILAARRNEKGFIKPSSDTPFDIPLCVAQREMKEKESEEKRLLASLQKIKEELSHFTVTSDSEHEETEEDDEEEGLPEMDVTGVREKVLKAPKWAQTLSTKKDKAREALKRKGLLSSLKTQSVILAEVRSALAELRLVVSKQESLQRESVRLHKALLGAERKYRETRDEEFLIKNVHYNMEIWTKKWAPSPKMVQRLVGSPGAFKTVMVEDKRPVLPLSEYLREDW